MTVVALVPAKDRADRVGETVAALRALDRVDRVVVIDDGSTDETSTVAMNAGAEVLRLERNHGKGGAVLAGVAASPDADVFLLVDADLGPTAGAADLLLDSVLDGDADLAIGKLPAAEGRGGFGTVTKLARWGIGKTTGFDARAPLSGQRAVRASLLRELGSAERFGLEVAMTIDAARRGARIVEVEVPMDHLHTGRSVRGFAHRGRQGIDVVRALWPRLVRTRWRRVVAIGLAALVVIVSFATGTRWEPSSAPLARPPTKVVIFGVSPMGFDDLGTGDAPTLERLADEGAIAAMSVRTIARHPTTTEGWISLGAGSRAAESTGSDAAYAADFELESRRAADVLESLSGEPPDGEVVVVGGPSTLKVNDIPRVPSPPGALGQALRDAGLATAVIGNADEPATLGIPGRLPVISRPVALALMAEDFSVDRGVVGDDDLLQPAPHAPFGVRADADKVLDAFDQVYATSDVVVVDPGDLDRADEFRHLGLAPAVSEARSRALANTDEILAGVLDRVDDDTLVLVISVAPPRGQFELTPAIAVGPGVPRGWLHSPSTRRPGLITITDLAPTILHELGAPVPDDMIGNPLRFRSGTPDVSPLRDYNQDTLYRERTYYPQAVGFIVFQAILYIGAILILSRPGVVSRSRSILRFLVIAAATYPLATFVAKMIPGWSSLGESGPLLLIGLTVVLTLLALRAHRSPLSPLMWVMGATAALIVADAATGTQLHVSSWLGYSLHSAGRFYGLPNTTFAVLAACTLLWVCGHVAFAPRPRDAVMTGLCVMAVVVIADGAPQLGGDVGGILTMVPVFGLTAVVLLGRRLSLRTLVGAAVVTLIVVLVAAAVDLSRPDEARTHLGRFAADVIDQGGAPILESFLRKQGANLRILRVSIWTWMIPIGAGFVVYLLGVERRLAGLLPPRSALRVGALATTAAALVGFATNDSGPVVIALFYVYLGPFLTLLALERQLDVPVMLPPDLRDEPGGNGRGAAEVPQPAVTGAVPASAGRSEP